MANILEEIVAHKLTELADAKRQRPMADVRALAEQAAPPRDFVERLRQADGMGVIAEVKKASPSAGVIREDFDPSAIAQTYAEFGASCISVLTDHRYFQGHLDHLSAVRESVDCPLLRKDFIIDRYQVLEARAAGADCILLIAECLDDDQLTDLFHFAADIGLQVLVEIYDDESLDRVLPLHPSLLGVNNRNLRTFVTTVQRTIDFAPRIPPDSLLVSESGIKTRDDVVRLAEAGVRAILVGESLMRSDERGELLETLRNIE